MKKITVILAVLFFSSCHQKQAGQQRTQKEELPIFLIYGELMPVGYIDERDSVTTQKFGFNLKRVANCEVSRELINIAALMNKKNDQLMRQRYGNEWVKNFE